MKGDPQVIENLQAAASLEANLASQYLLDQRFLKDLGLHGMKAGSRRKLAKHILKCILDRILFLGGTPALETESIESAAPASSVTSLLQNELRLETALLTSYQDWLTQAMEAKDDNTRNLFEHWIKWHEDDNVDFIEEQLEQISRIGEAAFIAQKL